MPHGEKMRNPAATGTRMKMPRYATTNDGMKGIYVSNGIRRSYLPGRPFKKTQSRSAPKKRANSRYSSVIGVSIPVNKKIRSMKSGFSKELIN
jgi:hypothetical protein